MTIYSTYTEMVNYTTPVVVSSNGVITTQEITNCSTNIASSSYSTISNRGNNTYSFNTTSTTLNSSYSANANQTIEQYCYDDANIEINGTSFLLDTEVKTTSNTRGLYMQKISSSNGCKTNSTFNNNAAWYSYSTMEGEKYKTISHSIGIHYLYALTTSNNTSSTIFSKSTYINGFINNYIASVNSKDFISAIASKAYENETTTSQITTTITRTQENYTVSLSTLTAGVETPLYTSESTYTTYSPNSANYITETIFTTQVGLIYSYTISRIATDAESVETMDGDTLVRNNKSYSTYDINGYKSVSTKEASTTYTFSESEYSTGVVNAYNSDSITKSLTYYTSYEGDETTYISTNTSVEEGIDKDVKYTCLSFQTIAGYQSPTVITLTAIKATSSYEESSKYTRYDSNNSLSISSFGTTCTIRVSNQNDVSLTSLKTITISELAFEDDDNKATLRYSVNNAFEGDGNYKAKISTSQIMYENTSASLVNAETTTSYREDHSVAVNLYTYNLKPITRSQDYTTYTLYFTNDKSLSTLQSSKVNMEIGEVYSTTSGSYPFKVDEYTVSSSTVDETSIISTTSTRSWTEQAISNDDSSYTFYSTINKVISYTYDSNYSTTSSYYVDDLFVYSTSVYGNSSYRTESTKVITESSSTVADYSTSYYSDIHKWTKCESTTTIVITSHDTSLLSNGTAEYYRTFTQAKMTSSYSSLEATYATIGDVETEFRKATSSTITYYSTVDEENYSRQSISETNLISSTNTKSISTYIKSISHTQAGDNVYITSNGSILYSTYETVDYSFYSTFITLDGKISSSASNTSSYYTSSVGTESAVEASTATTSYTTTGDFIESIENGRYINVSYLKSQFKRYGTYYYDNTLVPYVNEVSCNLTNSITSYVSNLQAKIDEISMITSNFTSYMTFNN